MSSNRCRALGCETDIPSHFFMCRKHWMALPFNLQSRLWGAWRKLRNGDAAGFEEYTAAARAAIEYIAMREGRVAS